MKKGFLIYLFALFLLLATSGPCNASYTFDMGSESKVITSGTSNVLQMEATVANLGDLNYTLQDGQSYTFKFASFYTNETWINPDDTQEGSVIAKVDFDNPDLLQAIGGTSIGFSGLFSFAQGWNLTWEDPITVPLQNGQQFTIGLSNVSYTSWFWEGPDGTPCRPGYADVYATVTLNTVPLPGSFIFLASGLVGLLGFRKFISRKGLPFAC